MSMMWCTAKTEGCDLSCPHYLPHEERGSEAPCLRLGPGKCLYCVPVTDQPKAPLTTVKNILTRELKALGADGLCCDGCGCSLDNLCPGLMDCDPLECVPAKKVVAETDGEYYDKGDTFFEPLEVK